MLIINNYLYFSVSSFIQQWCIQLIKGDSKNVNIITEV